jgi:hypothetical protein
MNLIIENWKKYLEEATEDYVNRLDNNNTIGLKSNTSFDKIFDELAGGSNRALLNYEPTDLDRINYLISKAVHRVNIKRKETKKDDRTVVNSVPMVEITDFKIKFNPETRKRSIGAKTIKEMTLEGFVDKYHKMVKSLPEITKSIDEMDHNRAVGLLTAVIKFFDKDFDIRNLTLNPIEDLRNHTFGLYTPELQQEADELVELVKKNKREITGRSVKWPDDTSDVAFILTREPLEIYRMSDHEGLQSCHSLGAGYDQCALADAQRDGAIIYSVLKSSFEDQFGQPPYQDNMEALENMEIFKDKDRSIDGIEPTGRVRVRKISLQGIEFAVLESAIYGSFPVGSRDKIAKLLAKIQESDYRKLTEPVDLERSGVSYGGTYQDTSFGDMAIETLNMLGIKFTGTTIRDHTSTEAITVTMSHQQIYDIIKYTPGEIGGFDEIGKSTVDTEFWITEYDEEFNPDQDGNGYYQDIGWVLTAKLDVSSIFERLDLKKLDDVYSRSYLTGVSKETTPEMAEFLEYFQYSNRIYVPKVEDGFANITFTRSDNYGSTDDLPNAYAELEDSRQQVTAEYVSSMQKIKDNPDLLLEIFKDFLKEETLSERLALLKEKFKRVL